MGSSGGRGSDGRPDDRPRRVEGDRRAGVLLLRRAPEIGRGLALHGRPVERRAGGRGGRLHRGVGQRDFLVAVCAKNLGAARWAAHGSQREDLWGAGGEFSVGCWKVLFLARFPGVPIGISGVNFPALCSLENEVDC